MQDTFSKPETVAKAAADLIEQIDTGGITEGIGPAIGFKPGFVGAVGRLRDALNCPAQSTPSGPWVARNACICEVQENGRDGRLLFVLREPLGTSAVPTSEELDEYARQIVAAVNGTPVPPQDAPAKEGQKDRPQDRPIDGDIRWAINVFLEKIAAKFDAWDTWDIWKSQAAETVRSFKHDLTAPLPPQESDTAAVPKSALDWLFGSGPDANGKTFDDARPDFTDKPHPTYWWRSHFRKLIGLGLRYDKATRTIVPEPPHSQEVKAVTKDELLDALDKSQLYHTVAAVEFILAKYDVRAKR